MIASHLAESLTESSILVLTDLSIIGRFKFPQNVDYVHLPGIAGKADRQYDASNLNIALENVLKIRRKITQSAAKSFQPNLIFIERDPFSLQSEMQRFLAFVREELPATKVIWGFPDVYGEPQAIVRDWTEAGIYQALDRFCDEIWVYGVKEIFDQAREYQMPASIAGKTFYVGYLRPPRAHSRRVHNDILRFNRQKPIVLITAGSGADGYSLIDNYLRYLESAGASVPFQSIIITGPMMRTHDKQMLMSRAQKLPGVIFHRFSRHMLRYVRHADLVICTGGYNTLCEILTFRKKAICVPTLSPPHEHFLRARIFERLGAVKLLHPSNLTPENLGAMIKATVFSAPGHAFHNRGEDIPLDGLQRIAERARALNGEPEFILQQAVS